jgi:hypothetical protein
MFDILFSEIQYCADPSPGTFICPLHAIFDWTCLGLFTGSRLGQYGQPWQAKRSCQTITCVAISNASWPIPTASRPPFVSNKAGPKMTELPSASAGSVAASLYIYAIVSRQGAAGDSLKQALVVELMSHVVSIYYVSNFYNSLFCTTHSIPSISCSTLNLSSN